MILLTVLVRKKRTCIKSFTKFNSRKFKNDQKKPRTIVETIRINESKEFKIGLNFDEEKGKKMINLLKNNLDIFAWQEKIEKTLRNN